MAKSASKELFLLVHSLSSNERKYLKLQIRHGQNENSVFLRLFEAVEKQNNFDDRLLYEQLRGVITNRNHFKVAKKKAYEITLKAMLQYDMLSNDIDAQLATDLSKIRFLFSKGLYLQACKIQQKAKASALKFERYFSLAELIRWEMEINHRLRVEPEKTKEALSQAKETTVKIDDHFEVLTIDTQIQSLLHRKNLNSSDRIELITKLLDHGVFKKKLPLELEMIKFQLEQMLSEPLTNDHSKQNHSWESNLQKFEGFLNSVQEKQLWPVFNSIQDRRYSYFNNYQRTASNTSLKALLKVLPVFESQEYNRERLINDQQFLSLYMRLRSAYVNGHLNEFRKNRSAVLQFLKKSSSPLHCMALNFILGNGAMAMNRFKEASLHYKAITKISNSDKTFRIDLGRTAYLALILAESELKSRNNVYKFTNEANKYLNETQPANDSDKILFTTAKALVNVRTNQKRKEIYLRYFPQIKALFSSSKEPELQNNFDFIEWFESKVDGEPFINKVVRINMEN